MYDVCVWTVTFLGGFWRDTDLKMQISYTDVGAKVANKMVYIRSWHTTAYVNIWTFMDYFCAYIE